MDTNNKKSLSIEEVLEKDGVYISTTVGVSMYPLFQNRRDTIIVEKPSGRLKKYDVPLYKRGEQYYLHRILKVLPDGYIICGDNCVTKEYDITDKEIIGVLKAFYRKNKYSTVDSFGYRVYSVLWSHTYLARKISKRIYSLFLRLFRKKQ